MLKRIFVFLLCALLVCASVQTLVFADSSVSSDVKNGILDCELQKSEKQNPCT